MQYIRFRKHAGGSNKTLLWVISMHIAINVAHKGGRTEIKQRSMLVVAVIIFCIVVAAQAGDLSGPVFIVALAS